jgi:hypothetical protein
MLNATRPQMSTKLCPSPISRQENLTLSRIFQCFRSQITALERERSLRRCQSLMATRGNANNSVNGHSLTVVVENHHVGVDNAHAHAQNDRQAAVVVEQDCKIGETVM